MSLRYRPFSRRQHLAIVALAIFVAVGIIWLLLQPPGAVRYAHRPPPPTGGGQMNVELLPPAAPASEASSAAR